MPMTDLPLVLRNNANWLRERGTFPKAAQACDEAAKEIERLRDELERSLKLQSHYAVLLNGYDGGERMTFANADAWRTRLCELGTHI